MDEATLTLNNGKIFHIILKNNSKQNKYIQSITYNGEVYKKSYILYKDFMVGGEMKIEMGSMPSKTWGINKDSRPYSTMDKK
jgi:putative alpha-1,2-mannosidase